MDNNNWVNISGPFGCETTAYIHASGYSGDPNYPGPIRIVTGSGATVNIL
tara:strand:- start:914 stop:1063 length:150 start_codon:yes stop_codon:yes gene_type:complete